MSYSPDRLLTVLRAFPPPVRYLVALSGGLDSVVLLHALARLRPTLGAALAAVHVHHGLQVEADAWASFCEGLCERLDVPLDLLRVRVTAGHGESLEACAREARYQTLVGTMGAGDVLLTAQHRDDQAETLLLMLLRGSGPRGLSAMPSDTPLGPGRLRRPLLGFDRSSLEAYARAEGLDWVEDPSNVDPRFDRNFLRRQVIPLLRTRWPALGRTLARSAAHCAEAQSLIDTLAREDLGPLTGSAGGLSVSGLGSLERPRARAVLRLWIREQGFRVPDTIRLDRVLDEVLTAAGDRSPRVHWAGAELRRYRDCLSLMAPVGRPRRRRELTWDGVTELPLPGGGRLGVRFAAAGIDGRLWQDQPIRVRFRCGGERCRPRGRDRSQTLKRLFQEYGVPPWERERVPLVYLGDELTAVGDLWVCEPLFVEAPMGVALLWARR